jgi:hypothetical protein
MMRLAGETEMKRPVLETFLAGVAFGMGMTILTLYARKPGCAADLLDAIARKGRDRKAKGEENEYLRQRLKSMGFSDQEIRDNL